MTKTQNGRGVFLWLSILCVVTTSGCSVPAPRHMYRGAKRPIKELATILVAVSKTGTIYDITAVDKVDGRATKRLFDGIWPVQTLVTPGKHRLFIRQQTTYGGGYHLSSSSALRWFVAEAGKIYQLTSRPVPDGVVFGMIVLGDRANTPIVEDEKGEPVPLLIVEP